MQDLGTHQPGMAAAKSDRLLDGRERLPEFADAFVQGTYALVILEAVLRILGGPGNILPVILRAWVLAGELQDMRPTHERLKVQVLGGFGLRPYHVLWLLFAKTCFIST